MEMVFDSEHVQDCASLDSSDEEWYSQAGRGCRISNALYRDQDDDLPDPWGSDSEPEVIADWIQQVLEYGSRNPYKNLDSSKYAESDSQPDIDYRIHLYGLHVQDETLDKELEKEMERLAVMSLNPARRVKLHVLSQTIKRPYCSAKQKKCLTAWFEINGLKAYTLCDAGSTTDAISPDFAHVAKIKAHPLENPVNVALGTVGSCSKINFGTYCSVKYGSIDSKEYWDVLNIDRYDAIVGTVFMREHKISLDFEHDVIHIKGKAFPMMNMSEDAQEHARRSRVVIAGELKPGESRSTINATNHQVVCEEVEDDDIKESIERKKMKKNNPNIVEFEPERYIPETGSHEVPHAPKPPRTIILKAGEDIDFNLLEDNVEVIQEFSRDKFPERFTRVSESVPIEAVRAKAAPTSKSKHKKAAYRSKGWNRSTNDAFRRGDILMALYEESIEKVLNKGEYTAEDIPVLREHWFHTCEDVMAGAPPELPPFRGINHKITLIDENKWYGNYLPRCPDALKGQLLEKIEQYTAAGWWEAVTAPQAAPMLCIPKKNGTLRTIVDCHRRNDNTVKDVTPFPDQDQIRLDVARANIRSKN
ncbi:hypothetical protein C8J56DRAFT_1063344 [Mycena floridula]|nr:hypothetical protein C8J56DRAFT_1063344 [Mycena floridula]